MNDYIFSYGLHALGRGMEAAATRFSRRMDEINAKRAEIKRSDYYLNYTMTLARQVDDLNEVLWNHRDRLKAIDKHFETLSQKIKSLEKETEDLKKEKNDYMNYVGEVWMEFDRIENNHQKLSCMQFAIKKIFFIFLEESTIKCDDQQNLDKVLEKVNKSILSCYAELMQQYDFKRGMPASAISSLPLVEKHVRKLQNAQKSNET